MATFGLFEAKTHLSELVQRAEKGEEIVLTRHGAPVARLVAAQPEGKLDAAAWVDRMRQLRRGKRLEGTSIRELIHSGRRA